MLKCATLGSETSKSQIVKLLKQVSGGSTRERMQHTRTHAAHAHACSTRERMQHTRTHAAHAARMQHTRTHAARTNVLWLQLWLVLHVYKSCNLEPDRS